MKAVFRNILAIVFLGAMLSALSAALGVSAAKRSSMKCKDLSVTIKDSLENSFVSKNDIKNFLMKETGGYVGKLTDSISLNEIEKKVDGRSAVLKSEAYITRDGILNIDITQRRPLVRFEKSDGGFYADADGFIFPLQTSYAAYVPIIDGNIPISAPDGYKGKSTSPEEQLWLDKIIRIIEYMNDSEVWSENIVQITVSSNGDLIMIPRQGKERFIFGSPDNPEEKFRRIEKYYENIVPAKGEGQYRTVNVKYDNQIICRK